jgi:hypothetical protein
MSNPGEKSFQIELRDSLFSSTIKETMSALSSESRHGLRESFALAKAWVIELLYFTVL